MELDKNNQQFVSRAGIKLEYALRTFNISVKNLVCADFGANVGGFTDCLLKAGAKKVYAIDTGYGVLDYKLRKDNRVVVMERTNAIYLDLPEKCDLITIDVGWTRQKYILPAAKRNLKKEGFIISLVKPHYEARPEDLKKGILPPDKADSILEDLINKLPQLGLTLLNKMRSPLLGSAGNVEFFILLKISTS